MQIGAYTLRDLDGINEIGLVASCEGGQVTVIPYSSHMHSPGVYVAIGKERFRKVASLFEAEWEMKRAHLPGWHPAVYDNLDLELRRFIQ